MWNDKFKYKLQKSYLPRWWGVVVVVTALSCIVLYFIVRITVVVITVIRALRGDCHCKHCNYTGIKDVF